MEVTGSEFGWEEEETLTTSGTDGGEEEGIGAGRDEVGTGDEPAFVSSA